MGISIGELFVSLGFDVDDEKLKSFNDRIVTARNDIIKMTAAATAALGAIGELISGPVNRASEFKQFQDQFHYSADGLQKWARVASTVNNTLTFDNALAKYKAFASYIGNADSGQSSANFLQLLGGNYKPGKDPMAYLEEVSAALPDKIKEFGQARVRMWLEGTGLGADYIDALLTNSQQRDSLTKGRIQSPEQIQKLDEINTKFRDMGRQYEMFAQNFAIDHGDAILKFLQDMLDILNKLTPKIGKAADEVGRLVDKFGGLKNVLEGVAAAWVAVRGIGLFAGLAGAIGLGGAAAVTGGVAAVGAGGYEAYTHWDAIKKFLDVGEMTTFKKGHSMPDWFYPGGGAAASGQSTPVQITNQNDVGIYINSNAPPEQIGTVVKDHFDKENRKINTNTINQLDLGPLH